MPLLTLPQPTSAQSTFPTDPGALSARWAIEFSPTTNPGDTPVWVDVTAKVRSWTVKRGRQRQLDRYETGTATIVLSNADRLFDPSYTAGTYYGYLLPARRFRIRTQYGSVTYQRFHGYVENWAQQYDPSNNEAVCVVTLADAFKVLQLAQPSSPWSLQIQSYGSDISAWYRLSEAESASGLRDSSQWARDGSYSGSPTMAQTGLVASDSNTCVEFSGGAYAYTDSLPAVGTRLHMSAWFSTSASAAQTVAVLSNGNGQLLAAIDLDASGHLVWKFGFPAYGAAFTYTTSSTYNDGTAHYSSVFLAQNLDGTGLFVGFSVDGDITPGYTLASIALPSAPANRLAIGSYYGSSQNFTGKIDEIVLAIDAASSASITAANAASDQYNAGAAPWAGDASGDRVGRVLTAIGWPASDRDLDTGNSTLQAAQLEGSALDHLQAVALTEQGQFFHGQDGRVTFRERHSTIGAASEYTFSESASNVQFRELAFSYDDTLIRNSVIAQRTGGGEVTVQDSDSVDQYWTRTYSQSGLLYSNDAQTRDFAQWIVNRYKDPALRVESMTISPEKTPATMYPAVFNLELGDLVTVERTPQGVGSAISRDVIVEGYTEKATPSGYEITFSISEADTAAYWILGDSTYSVLGTTTRLAF